VTIQVATLKKGGLLSTPLAKMGLSQTRDNS
jgi:hypothetical protein